MDNALPLVRTVAMNRCRNSSFIIASAARNVCPIRRVTSYVVTLFDFFSNFAPFPALYLAPNSLARHRRLTPPLTAGRRRLRLPPL